jgi:hypothetical protein
MRPALNFLSQIGRKLVTDLMPAALASALVGLIFSRLLAPPAPTENTADMARIVHDAQEIALDYSRKEEDLRRQMAMTTVSVRPTQLVRADASLADAKPALAPAARSAAAKKTERQVASIGKPTAAAEHRQPGEPLALSSFTAGPPASAPAEADNFLEGTMKGLFSIAKRVPHWAGPAADFVLHLPGRAISSRRASPADVMKAEMM